MSAQARTILFKKPFLGIRSIAVSCMLAWVVGITIVGVIVIPQVDDTGILFGAIMACVCGGLFGMVLVYGFVDDRLRDSVRNVIGNESFVGIGTVEKALNYLGHETKRVTDNALVANGNTLVYANKFLNPQDVNAALKLASKDGVKFVYVLEQMPHNSSYEIWVLAHRHDFGLKNMEHMVDAVYRQIRKGGPINPKQVC